MRRVSNWARTPSILSEIYLQYLENTKIFDIKDIIRCGMLTNIKLHLN